MNCVHEGINGDQAVFFGKIGEVGIPCGGRGTGMTQDCLDMTKA